MIIKRLLPFLALGLFFLQEAVGVEAVLTDDMFVKGNQAFATSPLITVKATSTGYVKFDFSTLPDDTLPQHIKKATLKLYASNVLRKR